MSKYVKIVQELNFITLNVSVVIRLGRKSSLNINVEETKEKNSEHKIILIESRVLTHQMIERNR